MKGFLRTIIETDNRPDAHGRHAPAYCYGLDVLLAFLHLPIISPDLHEAWRRVPTLKFWKRYLKAPDYHSVTSYHSVLEAMNRKHLSRSEVTFNYLVYQRLSFLFLSTRLNRVLSLW